jgi:hypothetical protein
MAERSVSTGKCRLALLLVSTALVSVSAGAFEVRAQVSGASPAANGPSAISIPAQPLDAALRAFTRQTGWQVGYAAALVAGRTSGTVAGDTDPLTALRKLLATSGIEIRMAGARTVSLVAAATIDEAAGAGTTVLEEITVSSSGGGVTLGTESTADTGTSTLSEGQITARAEGSDANGILRNLPNVQYQNDIDDDAGATDQTVIDLKPREVSISGARVYENNFILEGMEINSVTGSQERYGDEALADRTTTPPNADRVYGLHSQTVFVPAEFLTEATVIDSNASAKYGNFQGGVVSYKLEEAEKEQWKGHVSTDYTTSDWTSYNLGTEDGLNPNDIARDEYIKRRQAISVGGPLSDNLSVRLQYSRQDAVTEKDKDYRYIEKDRIEQDSLNQFYRGQLKAETDLGDFTFEGAFTAYDQAWEHALWRNLRLNTETRSLTSKMQHDYEFEDLDLGGVAISNLKLESKLTYGNSNTLNDMNGNVARAYRQSFTRSAANGGGLWEATELSDWCRTDTTISSTLCYDGATGDKEQGQQQFGWNEELTGDIWNGSFVLGTEFKHTKGHRRRPEDAIYYGAYTSLGQVPTSITAFVCNTTEECSAEQFASTKIVYQAFDVTAQLNSFTTYAELEQDWDWFEFRAGARLSYDDYMHNIDISPRTVATWKPFEDFSLSVGANRYYNAQSLAFAIRDQQPRAQSYTRGRSGATVGSTWTAGTITGNYTNSASDLETPYSHEVTISLSGVEPLFEGEWRLRFLDRQSKKQFASEAVGQSRFLTNSGSGAYQSFTAEYSKNLELESEWGLDEALFNASITWSRNEVSNDSYFETDFEDEYVWYKNKSYTLGGFNVVTGNMDIPLRAQAGLSTKWLDSTLKLDLNANYNFGYTGVKNTNDTAVVNGLTHEIYEDFDFDPTLTVDLAASYKVYEEEERGMTVNLKVNNLFNEIGNATASTNNPWIIGRTIWIGARAEF